MQTCRHRIQENDNGIAKSRLLLPKAVDLLLLAAFFCASGFVQAQTTPVTSISVAPPISHAMPKASSPVVGSGFYELGSVFRITGLHTVGGDLASTGAKQMTAQNTALSLQEDSSTDALEDSGYPSAADICALDHLGVLSEIEQNILLNSYHSNETHGANETLSLLLGDIVQLKAANSTSLQPAAYKTSAGAARLLRFNVNGQDVLKRVGVFYVSPSKEQRAFLVALDTQQDNGAGGETLHLLFKPSGEFLHYTVVACCAHTGLETGSFANVFAMLSSMEAFRTGNIISLKSAAEGAAVDLLLDLGEAD